MEALLLTAWVVGIVVLAYRVVVSERSDGGKGLGLFAFKSTIRNEKLARRGGTGGNNA